MWKTHVGRAFIRISSPSCSLVSCALKWVNQFFPCQYRFLILLRFSRWCYTLSTVVYHLQKWHRTCNIAHRIFFIKALTKLPELFNKINIANMGAWSFKKPFSSPLVLENLLLPRCYRIFSSWTKNKRPLGFVIDHNNPDITRSENIAPKLSPWISKT